MTGNDSNCEALDSVARNARHLKADTAELAGRLQARGEESLSRAVDRIERSVGRIWEVVSRRGTVSVEAVDRNVAERPWTAVFVAFLAGCAVSQMYRRKP